MNEKVESSIVSGEELMEQQIIPPNLVELFVDELRDRGLPMNFQNAFTVTRKMIES